MTWLALFLQLFPYVLQSVIAVEQSIGSQSGADKKAVVLGAVTAAAGVGGTVPEKHVQAISALIDSTVKVLNQTGAFGSSKPTAASATA